MSYKPLTLALFALFTLACSVLSGISKPAELTDDQIKAGIQDTLNLIMQAYSSNNVEVLNKALDLDNLAFSRFVKTRFNNQQESFSGGGIDLSYQVDTIEKREYGLVLAHISYNETAQVDWYFRQLENGEWALTEPTVEQTGAQEVNQTDFFEFKTYPIANDVNSIVEELMRNARKRVESALGKVPEESIEVEIIPTYGLYPYDDPGALAYYSYEGAFDKQGDRMVIYAPNSFLFGWYEKEIGWEKELEDVLTHEYTHMTHARSFDYSGRISDWIVEGLAEYVDGINRNDYLAYAIESNALLPLVDNREGVIYKEDIAHIYTLTKDVGLAYAEAEAVVAYIVEEKGGYDTFWKFAEAYDTVAPNADKAYEEVFGVNSAEFTEEWLDWVKTSGYLER